MSTGILTLKVNSAEHKLMIHEFLLFSLKIGLTSHANCLPISGKKGTVSKYHLLKLSPSTLSIKSLTSSASMPFIYVLGA